MKYILDSAMGTELNKRGFEVPDWKKSIWSAHALIHNPQAVKEGLFGIKMIQQLGPLAIQSIISREQVKKYGSKN